MSESEITTETVVIPGELTFSNPVPPPVTVPLPIVAWPHGGKNFWLGLGALLTGVSSLLLAAVIAEFFVHARSGADHFFLTLRGGFIILILLVAFPSVLFFGMSFAGAGLTCFWDAARSDPVLEISADGLHDRRSGLSVPWTSVKSAKPLDRAVDLQFHGPVANWQNPFRVGVLLQRYRPKSDHVIVSIAYLDTSAHVLAYTILTLTQRNGGEVVSKLASGLEMYPRLIPQRRALSVTHRMG